MTVVIDQLDDIEAVYALYLAAEGPGGDAVDLGDPSALAAVVREALCAAAGPAAADAVLERLHSEEGAGSIARAFLTAVSRERSSAPELAAQLDSLLAEPPRAEKMDMGLSLSLIGLGAVAMALMGTLEFAHEEEKGPGCRSKRVTRVKWTGSQNVPKVVAAVLGALRVKT